MQFDRAVVRNGPRLQPRAASPTFDVERVLARALAVLELLLDEHQALLVLLATVHQMQLPVPFLPQGADRGHVALTRHSKTLER